MKHFPLFVSTFLFALAACAPPSSAAPQPTNPISAPASNATAAAPAPNAKNLPQPTQAAQQPTAAPAQSQGQDVLLFTIGMHIEPLGATPSARVTGASKTNGAGQGASYLIPQVFNNHVKDIQAVAAIVEKHGGRMTIQAQSPFTTLAAQNKNGVLADLEARGHEIGLHFHEDAHLGKHPEKLSPAVWCAVFKEEIGYIQQAGAQGNVRYWSGGNLYVNLLDAATCAGLEVNSDWKNPQQQTTDLKLVGIHPWRPAGGTNGADVSKFAQHDPNGKIIFLPEGLYGRTDFASLRRADNAGGDEAYFEFLKQTFDASLAAATADKVNVFHFTAHPGEFKGDVKNPFAVIDKFLTEVVDPPVKAGKVKWATFGEMADAFKAWEKTHAGQSPK